jgi:hypothetical protein
MIAKKLTLYLFHQPERIAMRYVIIFYGCFELLLLSLIWNLRGWWVLRLLVIGFLFIKVEIIESTYR